MDDDVNTIGESDMVDGDEVSPAHSCKCKASCIRMFDRDDGKDHSLKVQELEKGEKMYIMGCLQRILGETRKAREKGLVLDLCTWVS